MTTYETMDQHSDTTDSLASDFSIISDVPIISGVVASNGSIDIDLPSTMGSATTDINLQELQDCLTHISEDNVYLKDKIKFSNDVMVRSLKAVEEWQNQMTDSMSFQLVSLKDGEKVGKLETGNSELHSKIKKLENEIIFSNDMMLSSLIAFEDLPNQVTDSMSLQQVALKVGEKVGKFVKENFGLHAKIKELLNREKVEKLEKENSELRAKIKELENKYNVVDSTTSIRPELKSKRKAFTCPECRYDCVDLQRLVYHMYNDCNEDNNLHEESC